MPKAGKLRTRNNNRTGRRQSAALAQMATAAGHDPVSESLEFFSEDFKLVRNLVLAIVAMLAVYVVQLDRRAAAVDTLRTSHELVVMEAIATTWLTKPVDVRPGPGDGLLHHVTIAPVPGGRPILVVDAAAQALEALNAQLAGNVEYGFAYMEVPLHSPHLDSKVLVDVRASPDGGELAKEREGRQFRERYKSEPQESYENERDRILWLNELLIARCPHVPLGATATPQFADQRIADMPPPDVRPFKLQMGMGVWQVDNIRIDHTGYWTDVITAPATKYFLFRDPRASTEPIQCADDTVLSLATQRMDQSPAERRRGKVPPIAIEGDVTEDTGSYWRIDSQRAEQFSEAKKAMTSGQFQLLEGFELKSGGTVMFVPLLMLILSVILSSVLRRVCMLVSVPGRVSDVLLGTTLPYRRLSPVDGPYLRGVEVLGRTIVLLLALLATPLAWLLAPYSLALPSWYESVGSIYDWYAEVGREIGSGDLHTALIALLAIQFLSAVLAIHQAFLVFAALRRWWGRRFGRLVRRPGRG